VPLSIDDVSMISNYYLLCASLDFYQTFASDASWDSDELIGFLGQKSRSQRAELNESSAQLMSCSCSGWCLQSGTHTLYVDQAVEQF